jgi:hypothetical protein
MTPPRAGAREVRWLRDAGIALGPADAELFLAAAATLLPSSLGIREAARGDAAPTPAQREALRELWLRTGAPPPAPTPMPLHPLTPGVLGAAWRRLSAAFGRSVRPEAQ